MVKKNLCEPRLHWTAKKPKDFQFWVANDFIVQLEVKLEEDKITDTLAKLVNVSNRKYGALADSPDKMSLAQMIRWAKALRMKVAVVAYDDGDPENARGPIPAAVFVECWKKLGKPRDFFELRALRHDKQD